MSDKKTFERELQGLKGVMDGSLSFSLLGLTVL
jgi:hypothetical protein